MEAAVVEDLPEPVARALTSRRPAYNRTLELIVADPALHNTWKKLRVWPKVEKSKAHSAHRGLRERYGAPEVSGFEFATVTEGEDVYLAVRYMPAWKKEG